MPKRDADPRVGFGSGTPDPEAARVRTLEREEREAKQALRDRDQFRNTAALSLIIGGAACVGIGIWFLVISPSAGEVEGVAISNLQRLNIGQTAAIVGAIFLTGGLMLKAR